jgi:hypothetical protein
LLLNMSLLDRLERIFGRFAIPNLSLYIVIGQVFVLLTSMLHLIDLERVVLQPVLVLHGQWWRVFTFVFFVLPPSGAFGYIFLAFQWYLFYLMGNALEHYWGAFRYNVFLLLTFALTIGASFITPYALVTNTYALLSVFLAFAYLNPDFELLLIIIPVKVKWLALFTWVMWAVNFVLGSWALRIQIAAPTLTFLLFFGPGIVRSLRHGRRAAAHRATRVREEAQPRHVCHVCGKTDLSHPELDFRYCSKCAGDQCYCPEHIHNHAHVVAPETESGP